MTIGIRISFRFVLHHQDEQACPPQIHQVHLLLHHHQDHREDLLGCDALVSRVDLVLLLNLVHLRVPVELVMPGHRGVLLLDLEQRWDLVIEGPLERIRREGRVGISASAGAAVLFSG